MNNKNKIENNIYKLNAHICQILADPLNLRIINVLYDKELKASDIAYRLETSEDEISNRLSLLKDSKLIIKKEKQSESWYKLSNLKLCETLILMRDTLRTFLL